MIDISIILDWLTFSCKFLDFDSVLKFLGIYEYREYFQQCNGRYFYKVGLRFEGHISIYKVMGEDLEACCVDISGKGCRFIESYGKYGLLGILDKIYILDNFKPSRIDIAMDVRDDKYSIREIRRAYERGNYKCRANSTSIVNSCNNGIEGCSLYFGKRSSNIQINIYDKRAEREFDVHDMKNWTRIEIRLRHENAIQFLEWYCGEKLLLSDLFSGILNNYLVFLKPNKKDTNKSRWKVANFWKTLLSNSAEISLFYEPGYEYDFKKSEDEFFKQCGSRIVTYLKIYGNGKFFNELSQRDIKLNAKQQLLIDNYEAGLEYLHL